MAFVSNNSEQLSLSVKFNELLIFWWVGASLHNLLMGVKYLGEGSPWSGKMLDKIDDQILHKICRGGFAEIFSHPPIILINPPLPNR